MCSQYIFKKWYLICAVFVLSFIAQDAQALDVYVPGPIYTFANDTSSDANVIQINNTNIDPNCNVGGSVRAYILPSDKALFAAALAATSGHLTVSVGIDTNAPPINLRAGTSTVNPLRCKVFQIIVLG